MRAFGKYRLIEPIASGGMAEVWRAEVPGAEGFVKQVALKLIRGDHDAHGDFVAMFIREARLASRLAHGNVVQVFDFDQVDGRYYIAMELVRGRTLRQVVDRCRELGLRFGLARAVHVCAEVARALAYAHRVDDGAVPGGVVHRDVSPQNVLLSFEGEVKLTDFGIARALQSGDVTAPGTVKGKLAYMAPEQARGLAVDARADVFSLGVILWELCTGRRLFARDSDAAMLAAVVAPEPVSAPSAWNEVVPPELDAVVLGALERDPARRTPTAEALAAALASLRLRLATCHEDLDVRAMLRRLWPDGDAPAPTGPHVERTIVRGVPAGDLAVAAPPPEAMGAPVAVVPAGDEDAPTRTAVDTPPRRALRPAARRAAATAVVLLAISAAAWGSTRARRPAPQHDATAPHPPPIAAPPVPPQRVAAAPRAGGGPQPAASAPAASGQPAPPVRDAPLRRRVTTAGAPPGPERTSTAAAGRAVAAGAPSREAGEATIVVRAVPWAYVTIDGADAGDTPLEAPASATEHHLHAHHPSLGDDDRVVKLAPGERFVWRPALRR